MTVWKKVEPKVRKMVHRLALRSVECLVEMKEVSLAGKKVKKMVG